MTSGSCQVHRESKRGSVRKEKRSKDRIRYASPVEDGVEEMTEDEAASSSVFRVSFRKERERDGEAEKPRSDQRAKVENVRL